MLALAYTILHVHAFDHLKKAWFQPTFYNLIPAQC